VGHHGNCRAVVATMVGVFLLFSHVKNAQCTHSYMKKGGQTKNANINIFFWPVAQTKTMTKTSIAHWRQNSQKIA
jgi:hypothetical protein